MEQLINSYYENNAKKLHSVINKIFNKYYGGTIGKDMEEFYGVGTDVLTEIWEKNTYNSSLGDFDGYVYKALRMAIIDEFKKQNRDKRTTKIETLDENGDKVKISVADVRLDKPISDEENITLGDMIQSDFNMDTSLYENMGGYQNEKIEKYLDGLPKVQRQIVEMKMNDISVSEIKQKLELTDKEYNEHCKALKSFTNISILFSSENQAQSKEDDLEMNEKTQTTETSVTDRISIAAIVKKIDRRIIRFNHPLQRESDQWSPPMKGNLVSDILQGNKLHPLIFAEQIINGVPIIWDLDGKQRCTNAYSFSKNGYKVSKNIRRWMIKYQTTEKDENGKDILDENGFPIAVNAEFDIRGKKFSDLPEELQDRFMDYSFNYDQYLNCSEEDIGYHIERYNDGKPMTSPQKGITKLGTEYAEMVKSISNMSFFKDIGGYKVSEFKNGTINRVVVESVMAANYLDKWNKLEDMCKYIKENSDTTIFDNFEDMVERLEKVVTDDVADMFDSKDSFLWFGLFARFVQSETDDKKFIEFMTEFVQSLHTIVIDGESFDNILESSKSTKDKGIVTKKINHLEKLMNEYLNIQENRNESNDLCYLDYSDDDDLALFISDMVGVDKEIIHENLDWYIDMLESDYGLKVTCIKDGSKLLDKNNSLSLLGMVAYAENNQQNLEKWLTEYAKNNNTYFVDQKKNYLHMKDDFDIYILNESKKSA